MHIGADWPGAANWDTVFDQRRRLLAFGRCDQIEAAELVVIAPASPVAEGLHPPQDLGFVGYLPGSCLRHRSISCG